ncbi:unnamed protein product [Angiostrongylus costaricensis]|uniref:Transposase n=1 Tax=Angiostrongylus costaricensis TaxID=334426 RepID=A0A0R3PNK2_ANGCS|nr:unnamed protein product [Angiostrongylus costaricensis]
MQTFFYADTKWSSRFPDIFLAASIYVQRFFSRTCQTIRFGRRCWYDVQRPEGIARKANAVHESEGTSWQTTVLGKVNSLNRPIGSIFPALFVGPSFTVVGSPRCSTSC